MYERARAGLHGGGGFLLAGRAAAVSGRHREHGGRAGHKTTRRRQDYRSARSSINAFF